MMTWRFRDAAATANLKCSSLTAVASARRGRRERIDDAREKANDAPGHIESMLRDNSSTRNDVSRASSATSGCDGAIAVKHDNDDDDDDDDNDDDDAPRRLARPSALACRCAAETC